jgi:hypothetical protein
MTVSAAFLVKDPPIDRLTALVEYIRPFVQQTVIVVDDRTLPEAVSIMEQWRDTVLVPFTWVDDFATARNAAIPVATGDWVLHLDPDEVPSVAMMEHIRLVTQDPVQQDVRWQGTGYPAPRGYLYFTQNYFDGHQGDEYEEHWHCRLFRRKAGVWYKPVHEQVMLDGVPEALTRGTPWLPKAPRSAYLIHSKYEAIAEESTRLYSRIEAGVG